MMSLIDRTAIRIAFLADIHGNLPALEAVLTDLQHMAPDAVYLLGDQINRAPWNNEVMDQLVDRSWPMILGNHEWVIARLGTPDNRPPFTDRTQFPTLWWTADQLKPHHMQTVRSLPAELHLDFPDAPPLRLIHGKPGNSFVGYLPEAGDEQLADELQDVPDPILVVAHTHRPMIRTIPRRTAGAASAQWQLFNGGSVGMPYNGDPRAQYLLLDARNGQWQPTLRGVEYDHSGLAEAFRASGMVDAVGPSAELHLRTALTGHPWSSDFGYWYRQQPPQVRKDMAAAVELYLRHHGPGHWAFPLG